MDDKLGITSLIALVALVGLVAFIGSQPPCDAPTETDPLGLLEYEQMTIPRWTQQSEDVIPGDTRSRMSGGYTTDWVKVKPEHDCTTVKGMKRGWLEYCTSD